MLKTAPNFVLVSSKSSTYPLGKERVLARLGWVGEKKYACGLVDDCFEHPH
jgi:hypothetical protein